LGSVMMLPALLPLLLGAFPQPTTLPIPCLLSFDGNDLVEVADIHLVASPHTITLFAQRAAPEPDDAEMQVLLSRNVRSEGYLVAMDSTGDLYVTFKNGEVLISRDLALADGKVHFVAITFLPDELVIAVDDGTPQRFQTTSTRWEEVFPVISEGAFDSTDSGEVLIGRNYRGKLAELLVWSPPLSSMQRRAVYEYAVGRPLCVEDELVAEFKAEGDSKNEFPIPLIIVQPAAIMRQPTASSVPTQLLRCLRTLTVGVDVKYKDGTIRSLSASNTVVSEQLIVGAGVAGDGSLSPECASVLRSAKLMAVTAERLFSPVGFSRLAADATAPSSISGMNSGVISEVKNAQRPHTHLFTLAQEDPQLLDDATQVLVMGIMAGMFASIISLMTGLAVGCWAGSSLLKSASKASVNRPLKLV